MEGEKDTEEEEEEEKKKLSHHISVASSVENLPIMHWEDLSERIAELEKQDRERRERGGMGVRKGDNQGSEWTDVWREDEEDFRRRRVPVFTSQFHKHRNLQLCFVNNSDSEEDEEGIREKVAMGTGHSCCHGTGLKQEVAKALRILRDKLLAEQKEEERQASSSCVSERKHLERWELQQCSWEQLSSLRLSLQQEVHGLSSELVAQLLVRDQLRTKQDAMLLDVQDLT